MSHKLTQINKREISGFGLKRLIKFYKRDHHKKNAGVKRRRKTEKNRHQNIQ